MKRLVIVSLTLVFLAGFMGAAELSGILRMMDKDGQVLQQEGLLKMTQVKGECALAVYVKVDDTSFFEKNGIPFRILAGGIVKADIPVSLMDAAARDKGIRKIDPIIKKKTHNDIGVPYINSSVMHTAGYTGDDVIVGIVDSGIDIDHPAFQDASGNTRIYKLLDQNTGITWTAAQIDAGTCTEKDDDPYSGGHGTHVAGSFAGYDTAYTGRQGSATTANIIFVKTNFYDIYDGIEFIYNEAQALGKPAIVNLSLGSQWGPHDGSDSEIAAIDALIAGSNGDLIVVRSAGNDGDAQLHGYLDDLSTTATTLDFNVANYSQRTGEGNDWAIFNFYYDSSIVVETRITDSAGNNTGWIGAGGYNSVSGDGTRIYLWTGDEDDDTRSIQILIGDYNFTSGDDSGSYFRPGTAWKFEFRTPSGTVSRIDGWVYENFYNASGIVTFEGLADPTAMTLATDACGQNVIVVGAYTSRSSWNSQYGSGTNIGYVQDDITPFSSRGPTRDSRQKPDITGPGSMILSTRSSDIVSIYNYLLPSDGSDGTYRFMQGTSMSSPMVAGGVALIKEANPTWDYSDIIDYFKTNSQGTTVYSWTASSWDVAWGWGVLDLTNAAPSLSAFSLTAPDTESWVVPSSNITFTWEAAGGAGSVTYYLEMDVNADFSTASTLTSTTGTSLMIGAPVAGTYYYRIRATDGSTTTYSTNALTLYSSTVQTVTSFDPVTAGNSGGGYSDLYLLAQSTASGDELIFEWTEPNTTTNFNYYHMIYKTDGVAPAPMGFVPGAAAGKAKVAVANSLNLVTEPGEYYFKMIVENKGDTSDKRTFETTFNVRDFKGVLLPNLLNDSYLRIGVVGEGLTDAEEDSSTLLQVNYSSTDYTFTPNGSGSFSSSNTFNNIAFPTVVSFTVEAVNGLNVYDTGITLSRTIVAPTEAPYALHSAIALDGEGTFTMIRMDHPELAGLTPVEGAVFYLGSVDSPVSYSSETHKLARWKDGAWRETRAIDEAGYYAVLSGSLPPLNFENGSLRNSPNPFNPTTTVTYTVAEPGHVALKVYDSRGRVVKVLKEGMAQYAGEFEVEWDGRDSHGRALSSGIYYAVLEVDGRRFTRKMVILK